MRPRAFVLPGWEGLRGRGVLEQQPGEGILKIALELSTAVRSPKRDVTEKEFRTWAGVCSEGVK